jgi:hypothetical protein
VSELNVVSTLTEVRPVCEPDNADVLACAKFEAVEYSTFVVVDAPFAFTDVDKLAAVKLTADEVATPTTGCRAAIVIVRVAVAVEKIPEDARAALTTQSPAPRIEIAPSDVVEQTPEDPLETENVTTPPEFEVAATLKPAEPTVFAPGSESDTEPATFVATEVND